MDHRDAQRRGGHGIGETNWLAVKQDRPGVRLQHAGREVDERALPCPVLAHQPMYLPGGKRDLHAVQGHHAVEFLADGVQCQKRRQVRAPLGSALGLSPVRWQRPHRHERCAVAEPVWHRRPRRCAPRPAEGGWATSSSSWSAP